MFTYAKSKFFLGLISVAVLVGCRPKRADWKPVESPLKTRWTRDVSPDRVWPEYPRPMMQRAEWLNLNGLWEYAIRSRDVEMDTTFDGKILVPFPVESALSGVGKRVGETQRLWYRRTFKIPQSWSDERVLLHFEAVDWETQVWVNSRTVGSHRGGYDPFTFDITLLLDKNVEQQTIVVAVWDPTDAGSQPRGKQVGTPRGIFYTPTTGIWRTVWLEPVPEASISGLRMIPDIDLEKLTVIVQASGVRDADGVGINVKDKKGRRIASASGKFNSPIELKIKNPQLWSPDNPTLYELSVQLTREGRIIDRVESYFGMRKISLGKDERGITRLMLNNEFVFQLGPLDQGFWPNGLYTPPSDEALRYDVEVMKKMGFNMLRKHVKVEPRRFYYWCDKLGLLVWQDMPNAGNETADDREQFEMELERMIVGLYNHPSIIMWVPFNEGWGQYDSERITKGIKRLDPSRLVNHASGWHDRGVGDVHDIHSYPDPRSPDPEPTRAAVLGEFGGLGFNVPNHSWNPEGWGYDLLQDFEGLANRYDDLFLQLHPLVENPGLSAAVYTQISDIESENNGLMTYDREVIKIAPESIVLAHEGYLSPQMVGNADLFVDETDVELVCLRDGATVRYTLDGSEPTEKSHVYTGPIRLTRTSTIKTRGFWEGGMTSRTSTFTMTKAEPREAMEVEEKKPGLVVSYYEGDWEKIPDFSTITPVAKTMSGTFNLRPSRRDEYYALKFIGLIKVPSTGVYVFYTVSDDGSRLMIGDEEVVDNDGLHGEKEKLGAIALEAGFHPIALLFFQRAGGKGLRVSYEGPDFEKQEIPAEILFYSEEVE